MTAGPVIVIDTREQLPYVFGLPTISKKIDTGDYSVEGHESSVCVERKSLDDFVSTIIYGRDRFARELERMRDIPHTMIIIEADIGSVLMHGYTSRTHPSCVVGKIISIMAREHIPVMMAGSRDIAQQITERFLCKSWAILNEIK